MDLVFIIFDIVGIIVALAYAKCGQRSSAIVTVLLAALTLIKVTWIRWIGVTCIILITICYILFRTAFGAWILKLFGRDATGRKLKP